MKKYVVIALGAIVATVIVLYVVPGPPIHEPADEPVVDLPTSTGPSALTPQPATVPPPRVENAGPTAAEYSAMLQKNAVKQAQLIASKDKLPPEAKALVEALPEPPPPTGNCAADAPEGECHWPTPEDLEEWKEEFDSVAQEEAGKKQGEGLFALMTLACPLGAAAAGVPPQAGMPACDLLLPLLDGLGMSLGEGDDILKAVEALQGVQTGEYSKLKDFAMNHPETRKRLSEMMNWIEQIDPDIRQRFAGVDLNDTGICDNVLGKLADEAAEELTVMQQVGVDKKRAVMEVLAGTIKDPSIRARAQQAIAGDDIRKLKCPQP